MRLTSILLFLCALVSAAHAQSDSIVVFTKESLFATIEERSSSVKLGTLMVDDANEGVRTAKNGYLPDINAAWEVGYLGNGYLTDRNFSNGMAIHNPHFVNNFVLSAMQIIYGGGAIKNGVRMAELQTYMANLSLEEARQQARFVLLSKLIDLQCLYKQREVIEQNIDLAYQVLDQMQSRIQQGLLLENDRTRYELQIENLKLQRDRLDEAIRVNNSSIATSLNYPENTQFAFESDPADQSAQLMSLDEWERVAASSSLPIRKARTGIDMSQTQVRLANAERLPHISAFAYGNFNSPITIEVPVLNKNFMYWGVGINVSYSLSSLFKTGSKVHRAKIGVMESEQSLELANQAVADMLNQAYQAYLTAQSTLHTQKYSLTLAEQNYDVVSSRFDEGMALITDLVDAANMRIAAQTGVENAQSQLLFCLYRLKYISNSL